MPVLVIFLEQEKQLFAISLKRLSCIMAIVQHLQCENIQWPAAGRIAENIAQFENRTRFPMCFGAIDGTHIGILPPAGDINSYLNRKRHHSIILQGICDDNFLFFNVFVGMAGINHDASVLASSAIGRRILRDEALADQPNQTIGGIMIRPIIVGDAAYQLPACIMKPYVGPASTLTYRQQQFNNILSKTRFRIEHTFGRLKGRWRSIAGTLECDLVLAPDWIFVVCILHNFVELRREPFLISWLLDADQNPYASMRNSNAVPTTNGRAIRDAIMRYL